MERYRHTRVLKDKKLGDRFYDTTIYPSIPIRNDDLFIYPKEGDRLDNLAQRYYQDSSLWWIIAKANAMNGSKPSLDPTVKIRIPKQTDLILQDLENVNVNK